MWVDLYFRKTTRLSKMWRTDWGGERRVGKRDRKGRRSKVEKKGLKVQESNDEGLD